MTSSCVEICSGVVPGQCSVGEQANEEAAVTTGESSGEQVGTLNFYR